jgi:hypothetical protein
MLHYSIYCVTFLDFLSGIAIDKSLVPVGSRKRSKGTGCVAFLSIFTARKLRRTYCTSPRRKNSQLSPVCLVSVDFFCVCQFSSFPLQLVLCPSTWHKLFEMSKVFRFLTKLTCTPQKRHHQITSHEICFIFQRSWRVCKKKKKKKKKSPIKGT